MQGSVDDYHEGEQKEDERYDPVGRDLSALFPRYVLCNRLANAKGDKVKDDGYQYRNSYRHLLAKPYRDDRASDNACCNADNRPHIVYPV